MWLSLGQGLLHGVMGGLRVVSDRRDVETVFGFAVGALALVVPVGEERGSNGFRLALAGVLVFTLIILAAFELALVGPVMRNGAV